MTTILQINASPLLDGGHSRELAEKIVKELRQRKPGSQVIVRDLEKDALTSLDGLRAVRAQERKPQRQPVASKRDELVTELKSADVVVLDMPAYPFEAPSALKAYFDHLVRAGVSFGHTAKGAQSSVGDRKFYVVAAGGGFHKGTARDAQALQVRDFLNFIGIHDVEFIHSEGSRLASIPKQVARPEIESLAA
jgi:FMN-dependent NADH-azoreductase